MMIPHRYSFGLVVLGLLCLSLAVLSYSTNAQSAYPPNHASQTGVEIALNLTGVFGNNSPAVLLLESTPFIQHAGELLDYNGAATCEGCHAGQVHSFVDSNHYQWQGKFGVMNDFCGYPDINFGPGKLNTVFGTQLDGGCATCHAGLGERPTTANPHNADCLICHANEYRRTLVNVNGAWRFTPDRAAMPATITIQEEPTRFSCLACHAYAGGGCNNKRGDISDVLANPTPNQDVHMGSGMSCVDCHLTDDHRIAGRGVDLRIDEGVAMRLCTDCHNVNSEHNEREKRHLGKVACQSCHIPTFARAVSTDMLRDFRSAEVNPRGLYEPVITRQSNVIPVYAFWNGESGFYNFRDPASDGETLAWPLGSINDGKLYPFKLHQAIQPQHPQTLAILPVKAGILFQTGNIDQAIRVGAQETGFDLSQGYTFVNTQRYMGIFHEMPPAGGALKCDACHKATDRVNFSALGYDPKTTRNGQSLCQSCHSQKKAMDFYKLHDKHVKDKKIACGECHNFER